MNIALVGNNDGPLVLMYSMLGVDLRPVCIGLQKPVNDGLKMKYGKLIDSPDFFSCFDENALVEYLGKYDIDLLINCFCNFKFDMLLDLYEVLNVHLAPLPRYRGRHPMHWALINGEKEFGVTIHRMDEEFDSGAILWKKNVPVTSGMSVVELRKVLMAMLDQYFGRFLIDYQDGKIKPVSNNDAEATYAPRRYPEDSMLTEWHDSYLIYRKVMALSSEQNPAFLRINNQDIPVLSASLEEEGASESKEFASIDKIGANGIKVRCTDGKIIGLHGFHPEKYGLNQNQKIL